MALSAVDSTCVSSDGAACLRTWLSCVGNVAAVADKVHKLETARKKIEQEMDEAYKYSRDGTKMCCVEQIRFGYYTAHVSVLCS